MKIQEFLVKREDLLKKVNGPYIPEEQQIGKQIMQYNQMIQDKLKSIKLEIQQDLITTKNQKRNTPKYMNPYPIINDGIFYDKRK
jgi:flagellar protein FliT